MDDELLRTRVREVIDRLGPPSADLRVRIAAAIPPERVKRRPRPLHWAIGLIAVALVAAVAGILVEDLRAARPQPTETTPSPSPPSVNAPAFRGQGKLAFISAGRLYLLDGSAGALRTVATAGAAAAPTWSPSGRWLLYTADRRQWLLPADGLHAAAVLSVAGTPTWSPSSDILAVRAQDGLWWVPSEGPPRRVVSTAIASVAWSPDARTLAYSVLRARQNDAVYTISAEGGPPREVPLDLSATRNYQPGADNGIAVEGWWPNGGGLLLRRNPSHSASIAADGWLLESVPLEGGAVHTMAKVAPSSLPAGSPDGRRLLIVEDFGGGRILWKDKAIAECDVLAGQCRRMPQPAGTVSLEPAWSTGGKEVAFVRASAGSALSGFGAEAVSAWNGTRSLWVAGADGSSPREITAAGRGVIAPMWSPDGKHILFIRDFSLWLLELSGSASVRIADGLFGGELPPSYYGQINWQGQIAWSP